MTEINRGIYTRIFEYLDRDGITQKIALKSIPTPFLKDLLSVGKKFSVLGKPEEGKEEEFALKVLDKLDDSTTTKLVDCCVATIKKSTSLSDEEVDEFVSLHFLNLFPVILDFNLNPAGRRP